ncbi:unnamed protein product [Caenorhabditis angaria]|uniref:Serpentine receptor class r-10 n=1 Tax=Caenorhabditis angaria TaxID=860376 RepID=A0A9P1IYP1_9PELO|nr:unnamed protein product [Caenorhabditis angaria]
MGNYRILMFSFSILGLTTSTIDILNKPMVHITQGMYIIFSLNTLKLPKFWAQCLNALNCSCYGMTISLLAVHFVYRYIAVSRPSRMKLFTWPYSLIWIIFCLELSLEWFITALFFAPQTPEIDVTINQSMINTYNLSIGQYIYAGNKYYWIDESKNQKHLSIPDLLFVLNIVKIILICVFIVFYCGISTYRKMKALNYTSKRTNSLQQQLFKALIVQTIIPMVTMLLPAGLMMIAPFFEATVGPIEGLVMTVITTYPFLDPIVVMYFVQDFRVALYNAICCKKSPFSRGHQMNSIKTTTMASVIASS